MIGALVGALVVGANQSSFVPSQSTEGEHFLGALHLPAYDIKTKVEELKCWRL